MFSEEEKILGRLVKMQTNALNIPNFVFHFTRTQRILTDQPSYERTLFFESIFSWLISGLISVADPEPNSFLGSVFLPS